MRSKTNNSRGRIPPALLDILIIISGLAILLAVFIHFNSISSLVSYLENHDNSYIHGIFLGFFLLLIGFGVFVFRRWREVRKEIVFREGSDRAMILSEERFKSLINSLDDVVFTLDRKQRHTAIYGRWIHGYDEFRPDVVIGKSARDLWGDTDAHLHETANRKALAGESTSYQWTYRPNGKVYHFQVTVSPLRDERGDITGVVGVGHDITEKIEFERELQRHEQELRLLLENAPDIVVRYDREGHFTYVNRVFENIMGVKRDQIVGKKFADTGIPGELLPFWHQELDKTVKSGNEISIESVLPTPTGLKYFQARVVPELNKDGITEYILVVARDLTKHKRTEDELRSSEEQLERILQTTPSGMTIFDLNGRIFFANKTAEKILGLEEKKSTQRYYNDPSLHITTLDGKPYPEKELPYIQVMMTGEPVFGIEHAITRHNGERIILSVNAAPLHDYQGKVVGIISAISDITKLKLAEESARRNEQQFKDLADSISDVFFAVDLDMSCTYWNKATEKLTGVKSRDAIGKPINEILPEISGVKIEALCKDAIGSRMTQMHTGSFTFQEHEYFLDISTYPAKHGISVFLKDVSDRVYAERERERLITELQDALVKVKTLSGLLPICAFCKKIRDDGGYWHQVESYIKEHSEANFSHGVCPECAHQHYPEYFNEQQENES
jgi:PAS domain S-box-containing protein